MPIPAQLESFFQWLGPILSRAIEDANVVVFLVYLLTIFVFALIILLRKRPGDTKPEKTLELLAIIVGSSIGICAGFFIGSVGPEGKRFLEVGGAVWGFVFGYVLAKLEPLFGVFIDDVKALNAAENKGDLYIKASMFLCCLMFTLVMTLNVRNANAKLYREEQAPRSQGEVQKDHAPAPAN
jgi:F0F1-type ATP synthase membrane subunit a